MSETIWRATDADGKCWEYLGERPAWKEIPGVFGAGYGNNCRPYHGPNQPPPGECWEIVQTRRGDIATDGEPIGWKIVGIGKDGSVLCEKGNGQRRRYLFGDGANGKPSGEAWEDDLAKLETAVEVLTKERDELRVTIDLDRSNWDRVQDANYRTIAELRAKL